MKLYQLSVQNFRGIKTLKWSVQRPVNCLVGCGDSTKTTILDAIDFVLSSKWNLPFSDSDFYGCDHTQDISIKAAVAEVPPALLSEEMFGLYQFGWDDSIQDIVDLDEETEPILVIELTVNSSLEPEWTVVSPNASEPKHISSRDRENLGVLRLGEFIDRHITWSRGSSLARMGDGTKSVREVIVEAYRSATRAVREMQPTTLHDSAKEVEMMAKLIGVSAKFAFLPGLDSKSFNEGSTNLSLHDGTVPLRMHGLGSRRLLAAAIQKHVLKDKGAILVDEVEYGLEPHRIIHLIRTLVKSHGSSNAQVFMTTHSPTVIAELGADKLSVVRCTDGDITVLNVPSEEEFSRLVRFRPEALLGRKIIVCEGPTECGVCWALDEDTAAEHGSFGLLGVVAVDGGGNTQGPCRAIQLADLGYDVAFFGDSDHSPNPDQSVMESKGVKVFLWEGGVSTEQRIFADVPMAALQRLINLALSTTDEIAIRDQVQSRLPQVSPQFENNIQLWFDAGGNEQSLRSALGQAAKAKHWFKNWSLGQQLGAIAIEELTAEPSKVPTATTLQDLGDWIKPSTNE